VSRFPSRQPSPEPLSHNTWSLATRTFVTVAVLTVALICVYSQDAERQKWAFGIVGTVLGYWLRS
jgi:hypothetical protein